MQLLKVIGILSVPLATSVTGWSLWDFGSSRKSNVSTSPASLGEVLEKTLNVSPTPSIYAIRALGIPVGFAAFDPEGEDLSLWLVDRMGDSTVVHELSYDVDKADPPAGSPALWTVNALYERSLAGRPVARERASWTLASGRTPSLILESGGLTALTSEMPQEKGETLSAAVAEKFPWPFLPVPAQDDDPGSSSRRSKRLVFNPLSGRLDWESIDAEDLAPFPTKLFVRLDLLGRIPLDLTISTPDAARTFVSSLEGQAVTLSQFTGPPSMKEDVAALEREAKKCVEITGNIHKRIVKGLSNAPYLLLRKATVFKTFCEGALQLARNNSRAAGTATLAEDMSKHIRHALKHEDTELPRTIARSTSLASLFDDTKHPLWIRSLSGLIENSVEELEDTVDFEADRKVPVRLKVILKGKSLGTVVKGVIQDKDLSVETQVVVATESDILPSSWTEVPSSLSAPQFGSEPPLLNGRALSIRESRLWQNLDTICKATGGRLGIDLGDAPHAPQALDGLSDADGVWDSSAKLVVLDRFLRRSMRHEDCNTLTVRVPASLRVQADSLRETIESEVIQAKQEIQLKNSRYRYLQLLPGTYELYVSAVISGELLETFEFTVQEPGKKRRSQQVTVSILDRSAENRQ